MRYTLLCSTAGTALSAVADRVVEASPSIRKQDVERNLCTPTNPIWDLRALQSARENNRRMSQVCSRLPRHLVRFHWRAALNSSLQTLDDGSDAPKVLVCHLTLFSPVTRETYVPGSPIDFVTSDSQASPHEIDRVIVLIDDIYDMYARLSGDTGVMNETQHIDNHAYHVLKLDGVDLQATPEERALLAFEVRVQTLEFLAGWRRAELLHAESLANAVGAPLTVLGVKHQLPALERLISGAETQVAYLSHKITEPRRENRKHPESWIPLVHEINALSPTLLEEGVVLVHPTAIDELRMASYSGVIGLTKRWPLQLSGTAESDPKEVRDIDTSPLAYVLPDRLDPPEYFGMFDARAVTGGTLSSEAMTRFRGFEMLVFEEISARDHLLVSCSDALVLYRPVVFGEDSSGARAEVLHWQQRWKNQTPEDRTRPRLVSLHVLLDIDQRLSRLTRVERTNLTERMQQYLEEENVDSAQARAVVAGLHPRPTGLHALSGDDDLARKLEYAAKEALQSLLLAWTANVKLPGTREGACMIASEVPEELSSATTAALVAELIAGRADPTLITAQTVTRYIRHAQADNATELCARLRALSGPEDAAMVLGLDSKALLGAVGSEAIISMLHGKRPDLQDASLSLEIDAAALNRAFGL